MASESDRSLPDMSAEELAEMVESGEVSIAELLRDEELRRPMVRAVVDWDMEEHRDVYERLAER